MFVRFAILRSRHEGSYGVEKGVDLDFRVLEVIYMAFKAKLKIEPFYYRTDDTESHLKL